MSLQTLLSAMPRRKSENQRHLYSATCYLNLESSMKPPPLKLLFWPEYPPRLDNNDHGKKAAPDDANDSRRDIAPQGNNSQTRHDRSLTPVPPLPEGEEYGSSLREFHVNGLALILLNLPSGTRNARLHARTVLRQYLTEFLQEEHFDFAESPSGPLITGSDLKISLSYAGDKALIGIARGRRIGVDIVKIERMDDIEALAKLYLPTIPVSDADFALAWAEMEACCKALKFPLSEINAARQLAYASCKLVDCEQLEGYRIAVATRSP